MIYTAKDAPLAAKVKELESALADVRAEKSALEAKLKELEDKLKITSEALELISRGKLSLDASLVANEAIHRIKAQK